MTDNTDSSGSTKLKMGGSIIINLSHGAYTSVATALKEYISNGWDAGAKEITVKIFNPENPEKTIIEILDDGCGMTRADLEDKFFRIGRDRRREEGSLIKTISGKRLLHGRKGLGKLAGLKMAKILQVVSWTDTESLEGAYMDLEEIEQDPNKDPLVHWNKSSVRPSETKKHGTLIRLENYSRKFPIEMDEISKMLSLWFEFGSDADVTLEHLTGDGDDIISIKKYKIARSSIFPKLKTEKETLTVNWQENGKDKSEKINVVWGELEKSDTSARSWISVFSGTRALSTEEDFDMQKGWTNMFGVYKLVAEFHADWLDKMDLDPADIKREGINWDLCPAFQSFREVGRNWLKNTCSKMARSEHGKTEIRDKTEKLVNENPQFNTWSASGRDRLINLVTTYASQTGIPIKDLDRIIELFAFVLQNGAMIQFLQSLKDSGKKDIDGFMEFASEFTAVEIIGLLQVTRNKLDIVKQLHALIKDPKTLEVARPGRHDITSFLATNPWIFDPELRIDHINVPIKTIVLKTERYSDADINRLPLEYFAIRPDFVGYLSSPQNAICIELKKPDHSLTKEEAQKIIDYRAALKKAKLCEKIRFVAVSGSFTPDAATLLESQGDVELMPYVNLLERGKNQLIEYTKKLERGLEGLDLKREK